MTRDETFALFAKGRGAWNAWAEELLTEREAMRVVSDWQEPGAGNEPSGKTKAWLEAARADFTRRELPEDADFRHFIFPSDARFDEASFRGKARFDDASFCGKATFVRASFRGLAAFWRARFCGGAWFYEASFSGIAAFGQASFCGDAKFNGASFSRDAHFDQATFNGDAQFYEASFSGSAGFYRASFCGIAAFGQASFSGNARFDEASFSSIAEFGRASFSGNTRFDEARFSGIAAFEAIDAKRSFSLADATFSELPHFIQAHFAEAPRLDNLRIEPRRFWPLSWSRVKTDFPEKPEFAARWRALKRLAIQGHDHAREQAFFRGELLARRWSEDKPWRAVFWFGVIYQISSDFGRSILRPLLWLLASVVFFTDRYLSLHPRFADKSSPLVDWLLRQFTDGDVELPPLTCVAGTGTPWFDALLLSAHKGLLNFGPLPREKLHEIYACLYGIRSTDASQPSRLTDAFTPMIPDDVAAWGLLQYPLSVALIFLALLAIRNHFRIR